MTTLRDGTVYGIALTKMNWKRLFCAASTCLIAFTAGAATPLVSAGNQFALALRAGGTISAWGRNDYGQLGNGSAAMRVAPAKVESIAGVAAVVAGDGMTLALGDDGRLWAWGSNGNGQLGDGTAQGKSHPVLVTGFDRAVTSVAASAEHALAVTTDGSVWAWGWGLYGQLGSGDTLNRFTAVKVSGLPAMTSVAAGARHSLALAADGTVYAWGDNGLGQLGDGTAASRSTPAKVIALSNIVAISTTASSNLALDGTGRVWAWGYGGGGTLGDGTRNDRSTPFIVAGLPQIKAIVSGRAVTVATAVDGSVWIWGDSASGQFGDSAYSAQASPVSVSALAGLSGFSVGDTHVVAQNSAGVWAWGGNSDGQLGVGDASDRSAPTLASALPQIKQVSAGLSHSVAVAADGSVWAWGSNGVGELADGTAAISNRPIDVPGLIDVAAVSAGRFHALALGGDGSLWAWGNNRHGGLGNGTRRNSAPPQKIAALPAMSAISAGNGFSLALEANGTVWSWGYGDEGQLGNGAAGAQLTPVALTTITGVTQLSVHYRHTLALREDGSVWAWGSNELGQLGDGSSANRGTPAPVTGLANDMIAVAAGTFHSLALDKSGKVWAWGYNAVGQLGDGSEIDSPTPVRVAALSDVIAIAAGENASYAITLDGRLWAWGYNLEGELGTRSTSVNSNTAQAIEGLAAFRGIAGGVGAAVALRADGSVWAWGRNFEGELGDATFAQRNTPVLTVNARADGPLDLNPHTAKAIPSDKIPPYFATADRAGDLSRISVRTKTKFNSGDVGKDGAVFVTAKVPPGSLVAAPSPMNASGAPSAGASALTAADPFVLIQLTSTGWQPVVNGQLLPYASGVLGDQLAAQTILDNADTTNLKGAQFCLGYGTSAEQMIAAGMMRVVATIPDSGATDTIASSCVVAGPMLGYNLTLPPGWNLLGNSLNQSISVASLYGDANTVTSVWKWDTGTQGWQFYSPLMDTASLQTYAANKGYGALSTIGPGEGYWVNAKAQPASASQSGAAFNLTAANLAAGWNLVATGNDVTPSAFNQTLGATPLATLWAWDNSQSAWYFHAPSLEAQGATALSGYIANKGYLDFGAANKKLGNGTGFWVNR